MNILQTIVAQKKQEILQMEEVPAHTLKNAERDFLGVLSKQKKAGIPHLIAEIKPASPITGRILPERIPVGSLAAAFESFGACALSVLTDEEFFKGSFENLSLARSTTAHTPLLCKDFILSGKQIRKARACGADSFLLIAKILSVSTLRNLLAEGRKYNMEAMVEISDEEDLEKVLQTDAKIVGINNRDLRDFSVQISHTFLLAKKLPQQTIVVSLSGFTGADIRLVKERANAVLVGTGIGKELQDYQMPWKQKVKEVMCRFSHPSPLIKLCGVRTIEDYDFAESSGISLLGINCVPSSHRNITESVLNVLSTKKKRGTKLVGVFYNQPRELVEKASLHYGFDFVQLSGKESPQDFLNFPIPLIKGISYVNRESFIEHMEEWKGIADVFLFDGKTPGAGEMWNGKEVEDILYSLKKPYLIAGGIKPENAKEIFQKFGADGVDAASGVENAEKTSWEREKIQKMLKAF